MKYCIWSSFHMNIKFLNVFQTSPFCPYRVPDIATWLYQTQVFHLLITSWHIFPVHYFTLAPFFAFSVICLTYINKSFVMKMSCLLPRAKLQRVTFFMKRSYLLPHENFKLPYLPNQAHWDPGICTQLRSSHIHSIHQKSRDFINGNFVYLALICAVRSNRGHAGKKVTAVTFFRCPTVLRTVVLEMTTISITEMVWKLPIHNYWCLSQGPMSLLGNSLYSINWVNNVEPSCGYLN